MAVAEYRINYTQSNFTGGIIAAELYGRNDFNKVKTGMKKCTNWTIREAGGLEFRRGTRYLQTIPSEVNGHYKMASLNTVLFFFCDDCIRYIDSEGAWQTLAYPEDTSVDPAVPIRPVIDRMQFTELNRRLYYYDSYMKLCEIYLDNSTHAPATRVTLFESAPTGATITVAKDGTAPTVYVEVEHRYTFSLAKDKEHETVVSSLSGSVLANAELTQKNSSDSKGQQVNVTITLTADQVAKYDGGKVLIYKQYQGILIRRQRSSVC